LRARIDNKSETFGLAGRVASDVTHFDCSALLEVVAKVCFDCPEIQPSDKEGTAEMPRHRDDRTINLSMIERLKLSALPPRV
jgi:hypothetical protein